MAIIWTTVPEAKEPLGDAQNLKGYDDTAVALRIERAQKFLKPYFVAATSSSTVASWDAVGTTPQSVQVLTALLAAAYICQDYGGQSFENPDSKAGSLWGQVSDTLKAIADGTYTLIDSTGGAVPGAVDLPFSTTTNKEPTLSMGNEGDGSKGTLDGF